MFSHVKCHNPVYLDMSKNMVLITSFSVTQNGIKPGLGDLQIENKKNVDFHCPTCKEDVGINDLEIRCINCGGIFSAKKLLKPYSLSGIYCANCFRELLPIIVREGISETTKPLDEIIKKLDLSR